MKGKTSAGLAGYVICTLPQCVKENDDIFGGRLNLFERQGDGEVELLCEGVKDPLVRGCQICRLL